MDLVEIIASIQKKTGAVTKDTNEAYKGLNVSDVWHMWDVLVSKYDAIASLNILSSFTRDKDLQLIVKGVLNHLESGASELEQMMLENAISLPERPPQVFESTTNVEAITDRYIYLHAIGTLKGFVPILARAFNDTGTPVVTKMFKNHLIEQMEIIDNISLYAEAKGYTDAVPVYQP